MAYVGTAQSYGDAQYTLASVLQGEAGNQGYTGMQAVGAVIQNRANTNYGGHGNDLVSQATAHMQFQGQETPGTQAMSIADQMLHGGISDPTGGALYYANPGASSAAWARNLNSSNSLQIGDHFFTDNTNGTPFSGNGATPDTDTSFHPITSGTQPSDSTGINSDGTSNDQPAWAAHSIPNVNVTANAQDVPTAIDQQTQQQASSSAQQSAAIAGAAQTTSSTQAAATSATLQSQQSWLDWASTWISDKLTRSFIVALGGILLLIGGLMLVFGREAVSNTIKETTKAAAI